MSASIRDHLRRPVSGGRLAVVGACSLLLVAALGGSASSATVQRASQVTVRTTNAEDPSTSPSTDAGSLAGKRVGIPMPIAVDLLNDWYGVMQAEADRSGRGASVVVVDANGDQAKQLLDAESMIVGGYNALYVVSFTAEGWAPIVEEAKAKGVCFFNATAEAMPGANQNVTVEHYQGGYLTGVKAGEWLRDKQGGVGEVGLLTFPDSGTEYHYQRGEGFKTGVTSVVPGVTFWEARTAADTPSGATNAANLLQAHPDIKVLFVWTDPAGLGALQAANEAERTDPNEFFLATVDGGTDVINEIAKDTSVMQATATFSFLYVGVAAQRDIEDCLLGNPYPPTRIIKAALIDRTNAAGSLDVQANPLAEENQKYFDGILTDVSDTPIP